MRDFRDERLKEQTKTVEVVNYLGELRIIGEIINETNNIVVGYIIMTERTQKFKVYTVEQTKVLLRRFKFVNAKLSEIGQIENTECAMNRLPKYNARMELVKQSGVTILGEIFIDGVCTGYRAMGPKGNVIDLSEDDIIKYKASGVELINAKVVNRGGTSIVSAIKGEFTRIDKKVKVTKEVKMDSKKEWIYQKHRDKLARLMQVIIRRAARGDHTLISRKLMVRPSDGNIYIADEIRIIKKEVIDKYITTEDDRALVEKATRLFKVGEPKHGLDTNEELLLLVLAQFILKDKKNWSNILKNYDVSKYRRENLFRELEYQGLIIQETVDFLNYFEDLCNKAKLEKARRDEKWKAKEFNTLTFKTSAEIAQLGFAINEKNRDYKFKTKTNNNYTLKYIGDYIDDFESYKAESTVFGDLAILAQINKTLKVNYFDESSKLVRVEVMLAIMAIYNPNITKKFIDNNISKFSWLEDILPNMNWDNQTDYKLSKELKVYYDSGFNVFLNDSGMSIKGLSDKPRYSKRSFMNTPYLNYRAMGNEYIIKHEMLYNELATIVSMITSDLCKMEDITRVIGNLRVL